jgi:hypothetical protein
LCRKESQKLQIKKTGEEVIGKLTYAAIVVEVIEDGKAHKLDVVLVNNYNHPKGYSCLEVAGIDWLTPLPEDGTKQAEIEEAVEKYVMKEAEDVVNV